MPIIPTENNNQKNSMNNQINDVNSQIEDHCWSS